MADTTNEGYWGEAGEEPGGFARPSSRGEDGAPVGVRALSAGELERGHAGPGEEEVGQRWCVEVEQGGFVRDEERSVSPPRPALPFYPLQAL